MRAAAETKRRNQRSEQEENEGEEGGKVAATKGADEVQKEAGQGFNLGKEYREGKGHEWCQPTGLLVDQGAAGRVIGGYAG